MLPAGFEWLAKLSGPLMVVEAVKEFGTLEGVGKAINPKIIAWAKETGQDAFGYVDDEIPWCGLFMAVIAKRAGKLAPGIPLRALSWERFGTPSPEPSLGDVLVFKRQGGGHVALYVGENEKNFWCLGGNQGDSVSIIEKEKSRLFICRRPVYRQTPTNVRPVKIVGSKVADLSRAAGATKET